MTASKARVRPARGGRPMQLASNPLGAAAAAAAVASVAYASARAVTSPPSLPLAFRGSFNSAAQASLVTFSNPSPPPSLGSLPPPPSPSFTHLTPINLITSLDNPRLHR
ncbi:centromere protein V-like [Macrobrachium nipponense]|uniref:centromere protein V-like n=1 Tax=Macrobrachium nipponense TaxID=159736 RepID=UPI0030C7C6AB